MGWQRGGMGLAMGVMCACSGRGIVGDEQGADTGEGDASDSVASMDSVGSLDDAADDDSDDEDEASGSVSVSVSSDTAVDEGPQPEDQEWLLALATFLDPSKPLQWHVVVDYEDGQLVDVRLQSLSLDMGSTTTPRQLVGEVTVTDQLVVDDAGNFTLAIPMIVVPGAANPITGSDIIAEGVRFTGTGMLDSSCGLVDGMVTAPISTPLTGSTFAATPITSVADLPLEFPVACE